MNVTLDEAGTIVRGALEQSVAEQCAGRSTGVLLSGGLDSTSVAAVATASSRATALRAYSALFPEDAAADESEFVEIAATSLGLPSSRHAAEAAGVLVAAAEHVREWRLPAASPNVFFQRPLLERARADGAEIVLDGQGGDELFGCSPYLLGDLLRRLRLPSLNARARELAGGDARAARSLLRTYALRGAAPAWANSAHSRLRPRPALHWLTPRGAELVGDGSHPATWRSLEGPRWWAWLADTLTAGRERMGVHDHLRRKLASEQLAGAHPLLDDLRLIELVLRLPPELAYDQEVDRPVLRRAMRGLVPEPIRTRPTKSVFNTLVVDSLSGPDRPLLTSLLQSPRAEIRAYVTDERLRDVVDGPIATDHPHRWAQNAWRLASTELWLRSLADAGFALVVGAAVGRIPNGERAP
jgi:asparagine synthase (glutamine-hydrolysing)